MASVCWWKCNCAGETAPLPVRTVFSTVFGSASDTDLFKVTQGDGTVRFFATPDKDQNGTLQLAVTFREKGDLYVQTLSVPYVSTKAGASTRDAYSAAQLEAAARAGQALGQAIINGAILDQDPVIDYDALEAAQRFWLEAGLNDPSEPLGLQQRINTATIDTIEDVLLEYHRWQATNQLLAVDDRFPIGDLETQLTTQYRAAVDSLLQLVWDWDPESSNEAPSAGGARRLLQLAAQVEQIGRDRFPNNPDDESYSFQSLLKRLGYELRIDHLLLDGPAEYALLTIDVNYYLYVSDPGLGGSGGDKAAAMTTDSVPVVVDVVPFNGLLVEEDGSFRRIAPGGHYTSAVKLAPGATELVLDVLATDPAYPTIFDWQRQIRLSGEYRLDATARKAGQDEAEWTSDPVISSHLTTPEQAVIRAELMKGRGLLEGQQVVAELLAPAKGQLVRDGDAGDRFIYTPPQGADNAPPGQEATQTIRLTTLIDGQRQTTDLTVTYRNVMAGTPGEVGPNSLWAWITRQFDALTTPLADQNQPEAGVGSSFGLDDIQLPSLGGSFNRAAGYAGGLLDWSMEAFDVLGAVELGDLLGFLQNGPPAETRDLIRFSFDLSSISAILSPTLLAADFTDLLPDGFSGQVAIDRPELTGQLVFGVDTSDDPFYILTRPDQFGVAASDQSVATDMGARFAVFAQVDSNVELFGGLLGIDHAEGHLSTKVAVDWSRVAAGDGKLRLSDLGQLQNLRVGFDGNPIDTFQLTVGGHAQIAGLSDGPSAAGSDPPDDPLLSMHVAGAIYKASLDTLDPGQQPPSGSDLPIVFELRTGSLDLDPPGELVDVLRTQTITDDNGQEIDDVHEFRGDYRQLLAGGPGDLGTPVHRLQIEPLALRDSADWFRFETTMRGTATSYVQINFAHDRGDLDLELFRQTIDEASGEPVLTPVRGDALAFGDRARVSLLGQPSGIYFMRVSDDAGGRSPYYSLTIQPPMPIDSGITANIQGFELRDTGLALSVDTDFNFDARLQGRLLIPYSLQDGAPTEVGFQADVNNEGLHAELFTEIGTDALMTRKDAVPAVGAISVDINQNQGGMVIFDYQSVDRFKFAGLEITTEHGTRWVIGQYEIVETGDPNDNIESREPRWTVLASAAAEELFGAPDTVTMRVQWDGGHVQVGRYTAANDSFEMQADYQFLTSFSGGLAGLGSPAQTAQPSWFANYRVWASGTTPTQFVQVYHDPLNSTPAAPWQVERGVWQPADSGLQGAPTEIHLGDWLLVARARLSHRTGRPF